MKIKDLQTVFGGNVQIDRKVVTAPHRLRFDEYYAGKLMFLNNDDVLNMTIKEISNIPMSTIREQFLYIIVEE